MVFISQNLGSKYTYCYNSFATPGHPLNRQSYELCVCRCTYKICMHKHVYICISTYISIFLNHEFTHVPPILIQYYRINQVNSGFLLFLISSSLHHQKETLPQLCQLYLVCGTNSSPSHKVLCGVLESLLGKCCCLQPTHLSPSRDTCLV